MKKVEYIIKNFEKETEIIDRVNDKEAKIKIRPLFYKENNDFLRINKKYYLEAKTPYGTVDTVITDKFILIPNSISEIIKNKIKGSIRINYWKQIFSANIIGKDISLYMFNSYVRMASFRLQPLLKTKFKDIEIYAPVPIIFSKSHFGEIEKFDQFLKNCIFMIKNFEKNKNIVLEEIEKNVPKKIRLMLMDKSKNLLSKKLYNKLEEIKPKKYIDFIYFYSELYKEIGKFKSSARIELVRRELIHDIFESMDSMKKLREKMKIIESDGSEVIFSKLRSRKKKKII